MDGSEELCANQATKEAEVRELWLLPVVCVTPGGEVSLGCCPGGSRAGHDGAQPAGDKGWVAGGRKEGL